MGRGGGGGARAVSMFIMSAEVGLKKLIVHNVMLKYDFTESIVRKVFTDVWNTS